jgi:excinuclease ABC subunit A
MHHGENVLMVLDQDSKEVRYFSRNLMCPLAVYLIKIQNLIYFPSTRQKEPVIIKGLGTVNEINTKDYSKSKLSIKAGGFARGIQIFVDI